MPGSGIERVRDEHPTSEEWRADALAGSRHSRLLDELRLPRAEADPERAVALCGEVCRNALRDLAPALILLPAAERRRAQALAAYALTLFDFARQSGLEGERLAQINRWQFQLEEALAGEAAPQPIFLALQIEERRRGWDRDGLDALADAARQRVALRRPATPAAREAEVRRLAEAVLASLLGGAEPPEVALASALLRLYSLLDLGEGIRRHDARLPSSELADGWEPGTRAVGAPLAEAVRRECQRVATELGRVDPARLPSEWRRAGRFLQLAGDRLLGRVRATGAAVAEHPPRLGLATRLVFLLRARLSG